MEQETLYNILTGQYGEILETHAMWQCIASLGIKPFKDGNQWCYLYGDNIQEGVCGFGSTIYKAAWDFYTNIKIEEAKREQPEVFDTVAFQKGVKEGKRLMMEGAVEGFVGVHLHDKRADVTVNSGYLPKEMGIKGDSKVKIIIVKEEEQ